MKNETTKILTIQTRSEILEICGRVLPASTNKVTLAAELADGTGIYGESAIDIPENLARASKTFF
jgi:2-phospho-L-lactate transferase/gluconeogenesis factor (CofD/UPF0052 family)